MGKYLTLGRLIKMKLLCALLLLVAVHELNAWGRWRFPPGPIGIIQHSYLDSEVENVEDRHVDETDVDKVLSERNVLDFLKDLDEDGDVQMSGPEFKDKQ